MPVAAKKKKLVTPSLERFYPEADEELGFTASDMSDVMKNQHYKRYGVVAALLQKNVTMAANVKIADIGCGSGYGTNILKMHFGKNKVYGVEPNDVAREYANRHYPECEFVNDVDRKSQVLVFVESLQFMSPAEAAGYLRADEAQLVVVAASLIQNPNYDFHIINFKTPADIQSIMTRNGLSVEQEQIELGVRFHTGETGDQYYGIYVPVTVG